MTLFDYLLRDFLKSQIYVNHSETIKEFKGEIKRNVVQPTMLETILHAAGLDVLPKCYFIVNVKNHAKKFIKTFTDFFKNTLYKGYKYFLNNLYLLSLLFTLYNIVPVYKK